MRMDDHLMTVLTGLVLAVCVGVIAQNSNQISDSLAADKNLAVADSFTVRAGRSQELDVLLNDRIDGPVESLQIVANPSCGTIEQGDSGLVFGQSEACEGHVTFAYCLSDDPACTPAVVDLNIRPEQVVVAEASAPIAPLSIFVVSTVEAPIEADANVPLSVAALAQFTVDTSALELGGSITNVATKSQISDSFAPVDPIKSASLLEQPAAPISEITPTSAEN